MTKWMETLGKLEVYKLEVYKKSYGLTKFSFITVIWNFDVGQLTRNHSHCWKEHLKIIISQNAKLRSLVF